MWFGRADSLKTWLLFSMAVALSTGTPWLGHSTKKSKVGIVDYETGKRNVRKRLYMLRAGKNENLGVSSMFSKLKPNQEEFWTELEKHGFDIVFVDSLRRANSGGDENDSGEAIVPLELAAEFSDRTGCAVVFIHHARKEGNDGWPEFRGSAAIEDQVDCMYVVRKAESVGGRKSVEVKCVKPGDMMMPEPFAVEVEFNDSARTATVKGGERARVFDGKMTDDEVDAAIELALRNGPLLRVKEILGKVKVRAERVSDRVDFLKKKKRIAHIEGVGYFLDSPEDRKERVFEAVEKSQNWRSPSDLAKGAHVPKALVDDMLREGEIIRTASGDDVRGFIRVQK